MCLRFRFNWARQWNFSLRSAHIIRNCGLDIYEIDDWLVDVGLRCEKLLLFIHLRGRVGVFDFSYNFCAYCHHPSTRKNRDGTNMCHSNVFQFTSQFHQKFTASSVKEIFRNLFFVLKSTSSTFKSSLRFNHSLNRQLSEIEAIYSVIIARARFISIVLTHRKFWSCQRYWWSVDDEIQIEDNKRPSWMSIKRELIEIRCEMMLGKRQHSE